MKWYDGIMKEKPCILRFLIDELRVRFGIGGHTFWEILFFIILGNSYYNVLFLYQFLLKGRLYKTYANYYIGNTKYYYFFVSLIC
jgi:hypothetical protein